jgi:predicted small metal-binding protein
MKTFNCKDVGYSDCDWSTSGQSDEEILNHAREHGREKHGLTDFSQDLKDKVRSKIRDVKDKVA